MVENVYKRINAIVRKATTDRIVNFVRINSVFMETKIKVLFSFSAKCMIPCMNKGKCIGSNKCRCPEGYGGNHCEVNNQPIVSIHCKKPCRHGVCLASLKCQCHEGWFGRYCNQRKYS